MIGKRIKALRSEINMSLRDLAKKVDLTASFLSQIERDMAEPSLKSLRRIADALGVPILYFLADEMPAQPLVRKKNRRRLQLPNAQVTYELLTPDVNRTIEMFMVRAQPTHENIAYPLEHHTEECILVLEGSLVIQLNSTEYTLEEGDSIYFEGPQLR
ncbi:MAG: helix-turn-helix domain-containing protein, partial [Spirochaetota bacterium]